MSFIARNLPDPFGLLTLDAMRSLSSRRAIGLRWARRIVIACGLAGALAYLPYRMLDPDGAKRLETMRDELSSANAEIASLRDENATLAGQVRALKEDPRAIEDIARHELGMVHEGDLVIRVETR